MEISIKWLTYSRRKWRDWKRPWMGILQWHIQWFGFGGDQWKEFCNATVKLCKTCNSCDNGSIEADCTNLELRRKVECGEIMKDVIPSLSSHSSLQRWRYLRHHWGTNFVLYDQHSWGTGCVISCHYYDLGRGWTNGVRKPVNIWTGIVKVVIRSIRNI